MIQEMVSASLAVKFGTFIQFHLHLPKFGIGCVRRPPFLVFQVGVHSTGLIREISTATHGKISRMAQLPDTRHSLLIRLAEPSDTAAWLEFLETYEGAVFRYCRSRGLQEAD